MSSPDTQIDSLREEDAPGYVDRALAERDAFEVKSKAAPRGFRRHVERLRLFFQLLNDVRKGSYPQLPWLTLASLAAALLYFLNPFDVIPDFVFGIGLMDDATVATMVFQAYRKDLMAYCTAKEIDARRYFGSAAELPDQANHEPPADA